MHRFNIDQLPDHPLLSGLDAAQLERMAQGSELVQLATGEILFNMGEPAVRFYMVRRGQLKLCRLSVDGQEKVVELLTPGKTFAEAIMFMPQRRYPVTCEALSECEVFALNSTIYLEMLAGSQETAFKLLGTLSMRLRSRLTDIEALAFQNATLRVAGYLLGLLPADAGDSAIVELPFSKKNVAARLSLQPETLSRVFARLRSRGLLEVEGGVVRVLDIAGLREAGWSD